MADLTYNVCGTPTFKESIRNFFIQFIISVCSLILWRLSKSANVILIFHASGFWIVQIQLHELYAIGN